MAKRGRPKIHKSISVKQQTNLKSYKHQYYLLVTKPKRKAKRKGM